MSYQWDTAVTHVNAPSVTYATACVARTHVRARPTRASHLRAPRASLAVPACTCLICAPGASFELNATKVVWACSCPVAAPCPAGLRKEDVGHLCLPLPSSSRLELEARACQGVMMLNPRFQHMPLHVLYA